MQDKGLTPDLFASAGTPFEEILKQMTRSGKRVVLVSEEDRKLLGIVTDYDVRVAILNHTPMDTPVRDFMNASPMTVSESASEQEIFDCMHEYGYNVIPVVGDNGQVITLHRIDELIRDGETVASGAMAVIMAGGLGERLRPMTDDIPKPMLPVGGRPILFTLLDQLLVEEFGPIYVSVNYKSDIVVRAINDIPRYRNRVSFLYENKRMGTAGSLSLLPERPKSAFAVINGDLLTSVSFSEMVSFHKRDENMITVALKNEEYKIPYGVAEIDGTRITSMQEKPSYSFFINTGAYVLDPRVVDMLKPDQHCDMTDLIDSTLDNQSRVGSFPVHEYWLDIGTPDQLQKAQKDYGNLFAD